MFPSPWKTARVVLFAEVKTVNALDDLRPISILLAIVVVAVVSLRLLNAICFYQCAFRREYNTSLLVNLVDTIRCGVITDYLLSLMSLYLTTAFNCVNHCINKKIGRFFRFSRPACNLILSHLSHRYKFVDINGIHAEILPLFSGVPRSFILGPLFFILYVSGFSGYIETNICSPFIYSDNI